MTTSYGGGNRSLAMEVLAAAMTGLFDHTDSLLTWMLLDRPETDRARRALDRISGA